VRWYVLGRPNGAESSQEAAADETKWAAMIGLQADHNETTKFGLAQHHHACERRRALLFVEMTLPQRPTLRFDYRIVVSARYRAVCSC
jgi:hypothetical protein